MTVQFLLEELEASDMSFSRVGKIGARVAEIAAARLWNVLNLDSV